MGALAIRPVLITETIRKPLQRITENSGNKNSYVFTGPCAFFGEVNDNGRVYILEDYLKHIKLLQDEINAGSLLGELQHPDNDDVNMHNASHIIRKLWYDEKLKCAMITIELMATRVGMDVMAMADKGVPIYISSRASGYIDEDTSEVALNEMFTFDIVYRPGFRKAKLDRVHESKNSNSNFVIYNTNEKFTKKINNKNQGMEYASRKDLDTLSLNVKRSIDSLKRLVAEKKESPKNGVNNAIREKLSKASLANRKSKEVEHMNTISNIMNENLKIISKNLNESDKAKLKLERYQIEVGKKMNELIVEHNSNVSIIGDTKKETDTLVKFVNLIGEQVNKQANFINLLSHKINEMIEVSNSVDLDKPNAYLSIVGEQLNKQTKAINFLIESKEKSEQEISFLREQLLRKDRSSNLKENFDSFKSKNNRNQNRDMLNRRAKIALGESKKREDINKAIPQIVKQHPFLKSVNENAIGVFSQMDDIKKNEVSKILNKNKVTDSAEIEQTIKRINESKGFIYVLAGMPKNLIKIWENLDGGRKQQIMNLASLRDIRNEEEISAFWVDMNIAANPSSRVMESRFKRTFADTFEDNLGYGDEDVDFALGL